MSIQQTFAMFKPGVLQRRIMGDVITRLEQKGFKIIAMKMLQLDDALISRHYDAHKDKPFYPALREYMASSPVIAMVLEHENAVNSLRHILGSTNPDTAEAGSIRGDYACTTRKNILHASDSEDSAKKEIALFFDSSEIFNYEDTNEKWY